MWITSAGSGALVVSTLCGIIGLEALYWRWRARSWSRGFSIAGQLWGGLTLGAFKITWLVVSIFLFVLLIGLRIGLFFAGADFDAGFEPDFDMDFDLSLDGLEGINMDGLADAGLADASGIESGNPPLESVDGYVREDGTVVQDYVRTEADGIEENNLGHQG